MKARLESLLALLPFLALSFAAAWNGARFPPGEWYAALAKPAWNPPSWVFAPVWTLLYLLIAVAGWLLWSSGRRVSPALALWLFQLVLNAVWSWLFFGLHRPGLALMDIVALLLAILALVVASWAERRAAAVCLLPYLAWVAFAAALNFALWRLNA